MLHPEGSAMENIWVDRSADQDIHVRQCGSEVCVPGHAYGPAVRDHHLIHIVASGRGTFYAEGKAYPLGAGQGFIIFPGQVTTYRADDRDPWVYGWIGYEGRGASMLTEATGLTRADPVFSVDWREDPLERIRRVTRAASGERLYDLMLLSQLYALLYEIGRARPSPREDPAAQIHRKAVWYLEGNFQRDVRIQDAAAFVGLSRSQLFRVFQKLDGMSPMAYLNGLRVEQAARLLRGTGLTLEQVAASSGFASVRRLSAMFRAATGISPGAYRREAQVKR
jgi:AraC-like DNA-binding protein